LQPPFSRLSCSIHSNKQYLPTRQVTPKKPITFPTTTPPTPQLKSTSSTIRVLPVKLISQLNSTSTISQKVTVLKISLTNKNKPAPQAENPDHSKALSLKGSFLILTTSSKKPTKNMEFTTSSDLLSTWKTGLFQSLKTSEWLRIKDNPAASLPKTMSDPLKTAMKSKSLQMILMQLSTSFFTLSKASFYRSMFSETLRTKNPMTSHFQRQSPTWKEVSLLQS
jgi:hypothetical protein